MVPRIDKIRKTGDSIIIANRHNIKSNKRLKYLAYIHMNRVNESQVIAEEAIKSGKVGSFKNEGKSFFEWAIMAE